MLTKNDRFLYSVQYNKAVFSSYIYNLDMEIVNEKT